MLRAEKCGGFVDCGQIVNFLKPRKGKYTGCDRHLGAAVDSWTRKDMGNSESDQEEAIQEMNKLWVDLVVS